MESKELAVIGPLKWLDEPSIFSAETAQQPGIYLWSIETGQGEWLYYIGETARTFADRMKEHLREYLGGMYTFFAPDEFLQGEKRILWKGMAARGEETRALDYLRRHAELAPALEQIISAIHFWLAPLTLDKRMSNRIEGALASHFASLPGLVGGYQDPEVRYYLRDSSEEPIEVSFLNPPPIVGFPLKLSA